jgi:hypothetical protein
MFAKDVAVAPRKEYVSPDGSLVLPAFAVVRQGPPDFRGWRFSHALDTYGFTIAHPGQRVFISNTGEGRTYSGTLAPGGALRDVKVFVGRGGESVTADATGRVFIANGQIFVYSADGRALGRIDTPERPIQLVVGGKERNTLFILSHRALYAVNLPTLAGHLTGQTP